MSEHENLIAEAQEWASSYASWGDNGLVDRLVDALSGVRAERDAALARIAEAAKLHRKYTYYDLEDSCPDTTDEHREEHHHEASDDIGEFYCDQMPTGDVCCDNCRDVNGDRMEWPCPTITALDGAPEPEWEYMSDQGAVTDSPENALDRRRKAGPWIPVESEEK